MYVDERHLSFGYPKDLTRELLKTIAVNIANVAIHTLYLFMFGSTLEVRHYLEQTVIVLTSIFTRRQLATKTNKDQHLSAAAIIAVLWVIN